VCYVVERRKCQEAKRGSKYITTDGVEEALFLTFKSVGARLV